MFVVTKTELEFIVPARFNDELVVTARLVRTVARDLRHRTEYLP